MDLELKGKIAILTGGSKGIGLAIKQELQREKVKVISISRSEGTDLMKEEDLDQVKSLIRNYKPSIIINNIGGIGSDSTKWKLAMQKNYEIMVELTNEFLETKPKWGRVVTVASIYGTYPGHNPGFTASKAAQIMFMKSLAYRYSNITFNCVSPGLVSDAGQSKNVELKSEDVANLVTFLCSNQARFINGQNIVVSSESVWK